MTRKTRSLNAATAWQELLVKGSSIDPSAFTSLKPYLIALFILIVVLSGRLIQIQLVQGLQFRHRAEDNRIIKRRLAAVRGALTDRNDVPLVVNKPSYKRLVEHTSLAAGNFEPISRDQAYSLEAESNQWIFFDIVRDYPYGQALSHVLGYLGEVDQDDLDVSGDYISGDYIGKSGVEQMLETRLRGSPGTESLEVNSAGKLIRNLGTLEPTPGEDIKLSLDLQFQQVLFRAFGDRVGAAVASHPKTGEILALVSNPAFDPNDPTGAFNSENEPFFNRAIAGAYPPGSVFKIVTATSGLEEGVITAEEEIEDTGEIRINQFRYGNWYFDQHGRTDGQVNLVKSLQRSNDIYFYRLGERIGPDILASWAQLFGYGELSGLGLPTEITGLVPSPEWKRRYIGERWFLGNTYHFAIGQGDLQVTPIQVNRMTSVIANEGQMCPSTLIYQGLPGESKPTLSCQELGIDAATIATIKEGMKAACDAGGTAFPFFDFEPDVACKTGTSQFGDPDDRTHAWFTVFAPADDPQIVLTILLEKGGEGSYDAAPIAKTALHYWFTGEELKEEEDAGDQ